jgi:hypothetical protein
VDTTRMGQQALTGWRRKVGQPLAAAISRRTRFTSDEAQAVIGAAFFLISAWYVGKTITSAARVRRG